MTVDKKKECKVKGVQTNSWVLIFFCARSMDIEKLRQKTLNLTNMASSCRKILMMNLLLFYSNGLRLRKNILLKRERLSEAKSLVLLIRSIMRTCRLRCRVRGCGAGWKILQFLSKIALIQQPKMKERDTLWCVPLISVKDNYF